MRITRGTSGRTGGPARGIAAALLIFLMLAGVAGCGVRQTAQSPTDAPAETEESGGTTVAATAPMDANAAPPVSARESASRLATSRPAEISHRVSLTRRGCIRFEPQWTDVRVGQSLTFHSELEMPLSVHVSPGVFERDVFLVRPGATVRTGPVRAAGRYSFWTEPAACREAPRGVLLAGPGVRVLETFYASAPGIR